MKKVKKKRWWPKDDEKFFCITEDGHIETRYGWYLSEYRQDTLYWLGIYKTKKQAAAMLKSIKSFVEKELGE